MRKAFAWLALAVGVLASGCTYQLRDEGVLASCAPLEFVINSHGVGLGQVQHDAIVDAVEDFAAMTGREADYLGGSTITYRDHEPGDPILIELTWPDDAPDFLGFANPYIEDGVYVGGWMYFNPAIKTAPAGMVYRLVSHELGHMTGLGDVFDDTTELMNPNLTAQDWGSGDLAGFAITHLGGCEGATLVADLVEQVTEEKATGELAHTDTLVTEWLATEGITYDLDAHITAHTHHGHNNHDGHGHDHDGHDDHDDCSGCDTCC